MDSRLKRLLKSYVLETLVTEAIERMEGINAYRESILRAIPTPRNLAEKSEIPRGYRRDSF